jgi:hypothetical protein
MEHDQIISQAISEWKANDRETLNNLRERAKICRAGCIAIMIPDLRVAGRLPTAPERGTVAESGDFQSAPGGLHNEAHVHPEARQHVNQGIRAEEIEATAQQVIHARLRDAQERGSLGLREVPRGNRFLKLNQQISADQQMRCFLG